jgi:hypothetical protein
LKAGTGLRAFNGDQNQIQKKKVLSGSSPGPPPQIELAKKPTTTRRHHQEFRLATLYPYLCFLFRKDRQLTQKQCKKGPLKLTPQQFLAAKDAFVGEEQGRWSQRAQKAFTRRNLSFVEEKWTEWKVLGPQLDRLRMIMLSARSDDVYDRASRKFDALVHQLKPRKKKEHVVRKDPLTFIQTYAERLFLWAVLKGEHQSGMLVQDLRQHYHYLGVMGAPVRPLTLTYDTQTKTKPVWIGKIHGVPWETMDASTVRTDPRRNANRELAAFYAVSGDSIPILLAPSRWPAD